MFSSGFEGLVGASSGGAGDDVFDVDNWQVWLWGFVSGGFSEVGSWGIAKESVIAYMRCWEVLRGDCLTSEPITPTARQLSLLAAFDGSGVNECD